MKTRFSNPTSASSENEDARLKSKYSTEQCPFSGLLVAGKQWMTLPVIDADAAATEAARTAAVHSPISLQE